jgi:FHA domain
MPLCPDGHDSDAADYCTVCGIRMGGLVTATAESADAGLAAPASLAGDEALRTPGPPCPRCGEQGAGQFCESCGYAVTVPRSRRWRAVVTASRAHYDEVMATAAPDASGFRFPDSYPARSFELAGPQMRIGRRSVSKEVAPEIDLTGPPADPGISRLHAILLCQPDGTWAVIDPGSENGTTVNGAEIAPAQPVQLRDGDAIRIGAWTSIAIVAAED